MRALKSVFLTAALLGTSVYAFATAPLCPTPREVSEARMMATNKYEGRIYAESTIAYVFHDSRFWFVKIGPLDEVTPVQGAKKGGRKDYLAEGNKLITQVAGLLGNRGVLDDHQWRCQYRIAGKQLVWAFAYSPVTNRDLGR